MNHDLKSFRFPSEECDIVEGDNYFCSKCNLVIYIGFGDKVVVRGSANHSSWETTSKSSLLNCNEMQIKNILE